MTTRYTRRRFLQYGAAAGAGLILSSKFGLRAASGAMGGKLTKYVERVPLPGSGIVVAAPSGPNTYSFTQRQISRKLHPNLQPTPLWAYDPGGAALDGQAGSFGVAVVAQRDTALTINFTHGLPTTYPSWIPVDTRLTPRGDEVRLMTHLHGGLVAAADDGNPAVTPNGFGPGETQTVYYPNEQPATLSWFHDHGLGATRLNVFAGLAAAYILRDQLDTGTEPNPIGIPGGAHEIPLVIQDRRFNPDGTFLYPRSTIPGSTWIGEYFGDVMLVNGKVWPFLEVEPRLYRFRILNGCNARILDLNIPGARMWQIGAEGGMWDIPVPVKALVLAPAERADVLVDFGPVAGKTLVVSNTKPPSPISNPAPSLPQVMQIRVAAGPRVTPTIPASLPGTRADLPAPPLARRRFFTLNELDVDEVDWRLTVSGRLFEDQTEDFPQVGTIEDWYYINLTGDTHPMHTHLFMHQVVGRVPFDVEAYEADAPSGPHGVLGGFDPTPYATGPMIPADPSERGFKETTRANPGQFTIIRARFDLPSGVLPPQMYVHHCHIVEHEDNDMMRTFQVVA